MKKALLLIPLAALVLSGCNGGGGSKGSTSGTLAPTTSAPSGTSGTSGPTGSTSGSTTNPAVNSVTLNHHDLTLNLTDHTTDTLVATVSVSGNASKAVTFTSSDSTVVSVDASGHITAHKRGTAVITATSTVDSSKFDACNVKVSAPVHYEINTNSIMLVSSTPKVYTFELHSDDDDIIEVTIVGATHLGEGVFSTTDETYFYNNDPIDGIASASFTVDGGGVSIGMSAFLSYNALDLDDILTGKYADLNSYIFDQIGTINQPVPMSMQQGEYPQLANSRYFLTYLNCLNPYSLSIKDFEVDNERQELTPVAVGTNEGYFTTEEQNYIRTNSNNSFNPTKAGNGAYYINRYYPSLTINQLLPRNEDNPLVDELLDQGFSLNVSASIENETSEGYQKRIGDVVHTFMVMTEHRSYFDFVQIGYSDTYPWMEGASSWPASYLAAHLTEEHAETIVDFVNAKYDNFAYTYQDFDEYTVVQIMVQPAAGQSSDIQDFKDYLESFNSTYYVVNTSGDNCEARNRDGLLDIQVFNDDPAGEMILFTEYNRSNNAPSKQVIASAMGIETYANEICLFDGGSGAYYSVYSTSETSFTYRVHNSDIAHFQTFKNDLEDAGFIPGGSNTYTKVLNAFGDTLFMSINKDPDLNIYNVYHYIDRVNWDEQTFDSFILLLGMYYQSATIENIANAITNNPNYHYLFNNDGDKVVVRGAGDAFLTELQSVPNVDYNATYNTYLFEDGNDVGLVAYLIPEGVMIEIREIFFPEYQSYTYFNGYIDGVILDDAADRFYLADSDNVPDGFILIGDNLYYYTDDMDVLIGVYELLCNRVEATGQYTYSEYLNEYIDTVSSQSVGFEFGQTRIGSQTVYTLKIDIGYSTFEDYERFIDIGLPSYILDDLEFYFPAPTFDILSANVIHDSINGDEDAWQFTFEARNCDGEYNQLLTEAGWQEFTLGVAGGGYYLVADNCLFTAFASEMGDEIHYQFNFQYLGQFVGANNLYTNASPDVQDILDAFEFNNNFDISDPQYLLLSFEPNTVYLLCKDYDEIADFCTFLDNQGFDEETMNNFVLDVTPNHRLIRRVTFEDMDGMVMIKLVNYDVDYVDWQAVEDYFNTYGHRYDYIQDYLPYPVIDPSDEYYYVCSDSESSVELWVSTLFDVESYINLVADAHPEYTIDNGLEWGSSCSIYMDNGDGIIYIRDYGDYYDIEIAYWGEIPPLV